GVTTKNATRVAGTAETSFFVLAVAPTGQALYYGTGTKQRGCTPSDESSCEGPPYYLRKIAAGETGSNIIRRARDHPFQVDAISQDGSLLLVRRPISEREGAKLELYSSEGERQPAIAGLPSRGGVGQVILPGDIYVLATGEGGE